MLRRVLIAFFVAAPLVAGGSSQVAAQASEDRTVQSCDAALATARIRALFGALGDGDVARVAELFPDANTWKFRSTGLDEVVSRDGSIAIEAAPREAEKLAEAVKRRDTKRVISMFPAAGGWYFDMGQTFSQLIEGTVPGGDLPGADRAERLRPIVDEFQGMTIELAGPVLGPVVGPAQSRAASVSPSGTVNVDTYNPGPIRWRATSDKLRRDNIDSIEGVSKMSLYCRGGLFQRVLLTPSRVIRGTGA